MDAITRRQTNIAQSMRWLTVILDCSSSMNERVCEERKFDHLLKAIEKVKDANFISFGVTAEHGIWKDPRGWTNMPDAFRLCATLKPYQRRQILLISDGLPDNPDASIEEALKLDTPINIIYIGPKGSKGEAFMMQLAYMTCGTEITVETVEIKLLGNAIGRFLPAPSIALPDER